jgi:hypothetical protein
MYRRRYSCFWQGWSGLVDARSGLVKLVWGSPTGLVFSKVNVKPCIAEIRIDSKITHGLPSCRLRVRILDLFYFFFILFCTRTAIYNYINFNFNLLLYTSCPFYSHQISLVYHSSLTILQYRKSYFAGGLAYVMCLQQKWGDKPMIIYTFAKKSGGGGLSLWLYITILYLCKRGGGAKPIYTIQKEGETLLAPSIPTPT